MLQDLDMTANLFTGAYLSGTTIYEIGNQFISTTRLFVDHNFTSAENRDLANGFHKRVFDVFRPDLLRVLLRRIRPLQLAQLRGMHLRAQDGTFFGCREA